jgi:predicted transcriptional regulator of viral defense system/very-short-patch-repair endonuclease
MGGADGIVDREIARIATSQHGVVTRRQLLALAVSARAIEKRLDKGWLIGVHPGVYRVGHLAPSVDASFVAAVYACGGGAFLSGRAAGYLLGLVKGAPPQPEVTAPVSRQIEAIKTHRVRKHDPRDVTKWRAIPVTTPARTLVDLAATLSPYELARAVHEAGIKHGTTPEEVEAVLARRPNAKGAAKLRAILHGDTKLTLSRLEQAFLRLIADAVLPLPETNRRAGGRFVDCRWPEHQITVELDGYRYHASRHAWELDRRRERQAYARGDQFRRYSWDDVTVHHAAVVRELRDVLTV